MTREKPESRDSPPVWLQSPSRRHHTYALLAVTAASAVLLCLIAAVERSFWAPVTLASLLNLVCVGITALILSRVIAAHSELDNIHTDLSDQSRIDPLTGLLNRVAFMKRFDDFEAPQEIGVLFFDLDKFKDVNDTLGHRAGDQLLVEVANRCRALVGPGMSIARLGGDEFAAIVPSSTSVSPELLGHQIVKALSEPIVIDGRVVSIGASVGVAIGCLEGDGPDQLLRRADIAMYAAKASGLGQCRVFDDVLSSRQNLESNIRLELGRSILDDDFSMLYQPVLDLRSGRLASVEALLRWNAPGLGQVPPSTLIPIAEESGLITRLTEWTLDRVLEAAKQLGDVGVAVNISPIYFKNPDFVHVVLDRLLNARVKPELLTLEITEGVLIENIDRAQQAISRLRDVGVRIFLDDFGTGYSSLSYLQHFAIDGLKLDRSFLRNIGEKKQATHIVRTMIEFGHSLEMEVVVEGIENEWQLRLLQLIGCDYAQGFHIGTPMAIECIEEFREQKLRGAERRPDLALATKGKIRRSHWA